MKVTTRQAGTLLEFRFVADRVAWLLLLTLLAFAPMLHADAFLQSAGADGIVAIEAENNDANVSQGGHIWQFTVPGDHAGTGAMEALPNSGINNNTGYETISPRLDYQVEFNRTGTHYVWILGQGATSNDDSLHIGLDDKPVASSDRISFFDAGGVWSWSNATMDGPVATIEVTTTGLHTLNAWMREDGFIIDRLLITSDAGYTPTGQGPLESPRGPATLAAPQFSPAGGSFVGSATVSLGASPAEATIYYTLDGSDPTGPGGLLYAGPLMLTGDTTVMAYATLAGYNDSPVGEADYLVLPGPGPAMAYVQDGSPQALVSIEAEHYHANVSQGGHSWQYAAPGGHSSDGAMEALPNNGTNNNIGYETNSPRLDYQVNFNQTGTHYVWVLGQGATYNDDSLHFGLDGQPTTSSDRISFFDAGGAWSWSSATMDGPVASFEVSSTGLHTLNAWMREDGFIIDKLVITTDPTYLPTGQGPLESPLDIATLAEPQISPDGGSFVGSVAVALDASPGEASIFYTLDGGNPAGGGGLLYTAPLVLTEDAMVRAVAVLAGYNPSAVAAADFLVTPDPLGSIAYMQGASPQALVAIEAEHYHTNTSQGIHDWQYTAPGGHSGDGAMVTSPNDGNNINSGYVTNSPRLDYQVEFNQTGTHYVWVLGQGATSNDDSLHIGLDGQPVASSDRISFFDAGGAWSWSSATMDGPVASFEVSSTGLHTLNAWMREDGFIIDKLVITTDPAYVPSGFGPLESPLVDTNGNQAPNGVIATPSSDLTIFLGEAIEFAGTATDADGDLPLTYKWNFGAGSGIPDSNVEDPGVVQFNNQGQFTVTFTVTDALGLADPVPAVRIVNVEVVPPAPLPRNNWGLVYTDSEELVGSDGAATNAFDGDPNTIWHTKWFTGATPHPHEIQINIGGSYEVSGFSYLPRQDGSIHGRILAYEFYVSTDGINWGLPVAAGTFQNINTAQEVMFAPQQATFVRLVTLSEFTGGSLAAVAELNVIGVVQTGNQAPEGTIDTPVNDMTVNLGEFVDFSGTAVDPDSNLPLSFLWNFGAGSGIPDSTLEAPGLLQFNNPGIFTASFTVTDALGFADPSPATRAIKVCVPPSVTMLDPRSRHIQTSPDLVVSAAPCLDSGIHAGWGVRFRISEAGGTPVGQVDDYTEPFEATFNGLAKQEYIVRAQIIDNLGIEVGGVGTLAEADPVGVGDYYVGVGDSITLGFGDDIAIDDTSLDGRNTQGGYPPILNDLLTASKGYPHSIFNEGIPGDTTIEGLALLPTILANHPEAAFLLIQYGTNDAGIPLPSGLGLSNGQQGYAGSFKANMQELINMTVSAGKQAILAKAPYANGAYSGLNSMIQQYNQVVDELILENGIGVTAPDFYSYFELNPGQLSDELHPDGAGYQSMSNMWFNVLGP